MPFRVRGNSSERDVREKRRLEQLETFWKLRAQGLELKQIGEIMGVTKARMWNLKKKDLQSKLLAAGDARDEFIKLELERLDKAERRAELIIRRRLDAERADEVMAHADDGTPYKLPWLKPDDAKVVMAALDEQRKCRVERAKYLALYAPERKEVTGKNGGPIAMIDVSKLSDAEIQRLTSGTPSASGDGAPPETAVEQPDDVRPEGDATVDEAGAPKPDR